MKFKERIIKLQTSVDALTLRERLMLFAAALVIAGGLWEALLAAPLETREAAASNELAAISQRLEQLDEAMELAAQGIGGGMSGQIDRLRLLEDQVEEAEASVRVFTSDLVGPTQMRHVLEQLIEQQNGLRLIRASNLDVRPLIEPVNSEPDSEAEAVEAPMLYRHGFRLELEGRYLDCLQYLEAVEALPWKIYWGGLSLEASEYPLNEIVIELFTLSLDEEWIGV